jgi:hypothetical protein
MHEIWTCPDCSVNPDGKLIRVHVYRNPRLRIIASGDYYGRVKIIHKCNG